MMCPKLHFEYPKAILPSFVYINRRFRPDNFISPLASNTDAYTAIDAQFYKGFSNSSDRFSQISRKIRLTASNMYRKKLFDIIRSHQR
jgi:hypothetical protein